MYLISNPHSLFHLLLTAIFLHIIPIKSGIMSPSNFLTVSKSQRSFLCFSNSLPVNFSLMCAIEANMLFI